jgi:rSAM/selenodomain-associated transferase 1
MVSLILFGRLPSAGKVKTRLARSLGEEQAAEFYRLCVENVFQESARLPENVQRYFAYSGTSDSAEIQRWVGPQFHLFAQTEGDLGRRLEHAFDIVFSRGAQKAVIVATDVPELSADTLQCAIRALDSCDIVLGPCPDGGYYLLGIKQLHRELFADIPWSTDQVLDGTLKTIRRLRLSLHLLPMLPDIDTGEDLRRWRSEPAARGSHPIHAFVRSLDL